MEHKLLVTYQQIFKRKLNTPTWAVHKVTPEHTHELVHCPVPFVGKHYSQEETKILLYASAENLSGYNGYLDRDEYAVNRHRNSFNESTINSDSFFPNVHIQPINDGCLPIVALYVYMQVQTIDWISPAEFLERIAFANYCKYTIEKGHRNEDYASNINYLRESHDYIEQDISILRPDIIIMPKSIYETDLEFIQKVVKEAKIIPIYQMNARNINLRIKKYPKTSEQELPKVLWDWYAHLGVNGINGKTKENFLSVFRYMDDLLQSKIEQTL